MDELLKDAIADAKAVRETALANAKLALEEAFTPRLKSMLSKKIQSEMEDAVEELDIEELDDEEDVEDEMGDEAPEDDMEDEGSYSEDDEDPSDEFSDEEAPEDDMGDEEDMGDEDDMDDEEEEMEGVIEINGVKYAPIREDEEFTEADESDEEDDEVDEGEDLDLDEILRELEEDDSVDEVAEPVDEDEEIDEQSTSSGIGKGTGVKQGSGSDEEDPGKGKLKEAEEAEEAEEDEEEVDESKTVEEDIDLEEVLRALTEDDAEATTEEVKTLKGDLKEHRKVVKYLREKLNEVNLLNAKLLFTNKIFRAFGMTNEQKMKVVETFDRARTLREIKLVYTTVAENFGNETIKPIKETKGTASKVVASTKSKKQEQEIISESDNMKARFQKLANIL